MTTLLSREQVDALRSIGDSALVFWALVMIDANYPGRATRPAEIAMLVKKDVRTVEKQLTELCAGNRAVRNAAGYVLLDGGRALVLGMNQALAQSPALNAQAQATEAQAQPELQDLMDVDVAHNACALKQEEDSIELININSSSSDSGAQNVLALTVENILAQSKLLFERPVVLAGLKLDMLNANYALACLAHAYDQSAHLRNPVGLAYNMLKFVNRPRREYLASPMTYLPNEFRELFGAALYTCTWGRECGQAFTRAAELDAHLRDVHGAVEREAVPVTAPAVAESTDAEVQALWGKALYVLRGELPKASFDTWVASAFAVAFDDGIFTVGARDGVALDWLTLRLTKRASEIVGAPVKFVDGGSR